MSQRGGPCDWPCRPCSFCCALQGLANTLCNLRHPRCDLVSYHLLAANPSMLGALRAIFLKPMQAVRSLGGQSRPLRTPTVCPNLRTCATQAPQSILL